LYAEKEEEDESTEEANPHHIRIYYGMYRIPCSKYCPADYYPDSPKGECPTDNKPGEELNYVITQLISAST